jgi:7-cyano-7-deazaguanine reductase
MAFEPLSNPEDLAKLGSGSSDFDGVVEPADKRLLEAFPNPMAKVAGHGLVTLGGYDDPKEFTSLCPKTGQPDFARIVVEYVPDELCVESKSWKLYLGSFRTAQEFHEACVARIARDLTELLDPLWLRVTGEFTPRGGISINPCFTYEKSEHRPDGSIKPPLN